MGIAKFGHACLRLENNGQVIVIDPGVMTTEPDALTGVEAVLITHEHFDHFDPQRLRDVRSPIYTCAGVARHLNEFG